MCMRYACACSCLHGLGNIPGIGRSGVVPGIGGRSGVVPGIGGRSGVVPGIGGRSGVVPGIGGRSGVVPGIGGRSGVHGSWHRRTFRCGTCKEQQATEWICLHAKDT